MKQLVFALIFCFVIQNVFTQSVTVSARLGGKDYTKSVPNTIEAFHLGNIHQNYTKIQGLEFLPRLAKLELTFTSTDLDLSFLKNLKQLQVLILNVCSIRNLDFLKFIPNIKVLYLENVPITQPVIDLSSNKKLEYVAFVCTFNAVDYQNLPYQIVNIPSSLKYVNLSSNLLPNTNDTILWSLSKVECVLINKNTFKDKIDLQKYPSNIHYIEQYDLLPPNYNDNGILTRIENGFW